MPSTRQASVRRLTRLFQQVRDPLIVLDDRRQVVFVNRAWEELTGFTVEEVLDRGCQPQGPSGEPSLDGILGSFFPPPEAMQGQPHGGSTLIVHASGERLWRRVEYWPLCDADGAVLGLFGIARPHDVVPHAPDSEVQRLRAELEDVRSQLRSRPGAESLIGRGPEHRRLLDQVATAAASSVPVLVVGEPGTGRRLTARTIHAQGPHAEAPLVPLDCAALPPEILERELQAATRGDRNATTTPAEGTSLLLIDVVELPRDLQARLAALRDGGVRVLATSALDPDAARQQERLRPELYFALTTLVIRLSPLRERLDELPLLAQHFLDRACWREERRLAGFTPDALGALAGYDWPGNLRELARVVDAAYRQARGDLIEVGDLPGSIRGHLGAAYDPPPMPPPVPALDATLTIVERRLIELAMKHARHNKSRAADLLEISRPRLYRRMKELNIPDEVEPGDEPSAERPAPNELDPHEVAP